MFDDRQFTKSRLYHWIMKICYDISSSVDTTLKFIHNFQHSQLASLSDGAHSYEKDGLTHWMTRLNEELAKLEAVQAEVQALKDQVRELVGSYFCFSQDFRTSPNTYRY